MTTTDPGVPSTAPQPAPLDLAPIEARIEKAHDHIAKLCSGEERWTMRVPAQLERDSDLVIGTALNDVDRLVAEVRRLRAELDATRAVGEKLRRALYGQHEAAGHALDVHAFGEDCPPCRQAADEFDGDKACDRWRAWQTEYEAAVGLPLSTVPPAGTGAQ